MSERRDSYYEKNLEYLFSYFKSGYKSNLEDFIKWVNDNTGYEFKHFLEDYSLKNDNQEKKYGIEDNNFIPQSTIEEIIRRQNQKEIEPDELALYHCIQVKNSSMEIYKDNKNAIKCDVRNVYTELEEFFKEIESKYFLKISNYYRKKSIDDTYYFYCDDEVDAKKYLCKWASDYRKYKRTRKMQEKPDEFIFNFFRKSSILFCKLFPRYIEVNEKNRKNEILLQEYKGVKERKNENAIVNYCIWTLYFEEEKLEDWERFQNVYEKNDVGLKNREMFELLEKRKEEWLLYTNSIELLRERINRITGLGKVDSSKAMKRLLLYELELKHEILEVVKEYIEDKNNVDMFVTMSDEDVDKWLKQVMVLYHGACSLN